MKTIMFNEEPTDLMHDVLCGQKDMTRRLVSDCHIKAWKKYQKKYPGTKMDMAQFLIRNGYAKYVVGEVVAIAESYKSLRLSPNMTVIPKRGNAPVRISEMAGWKNKMFVVADLMRHHIRITSVGVERLHDITDEDIKREGIFEIGYDQDKDLTLYGSSRKTREVLGYSLRHAFQTLINKIGTSSTWGSNPWVYVYGFELID